VNVFYHRTYCSVAQTVVTNSNFNILGVVKVLSNFEFVFLLKLGED